MGEYGSNVLEDKVKSEMETCEREINERGVSNIEEFLRERLEKWREVKVNIAVTGDSGVGKSSFINAIRELFDDDKGAAPVDVMECTVEPTPYDHPSNSNIKFWDLPGIGTPNYPDLKTYDQKVQLDKYDAFLILTANRFTENDLLLSETVKSMKKSFFCIRTKIDHNVRDESARKRSSGSFDEEAMLTKIRRNCLENLSDLLRDEKDVFLISNHQPDKWDFVRLTQAILDALPRFQRESMTFSLGKAIMKTSTEIFQRKVDALKSRMWQIAAASAIAALVPLPGLSFGVDTTLILSELRFYRFELGLPETDSDEFERLPPVTKRKVLEARGISTAANLCAFLATCSTEAVFEEAVRFIPVFGWILAGSMSYSATYYALHTLLKTVEDAAFAVIREAAEKTTAELASQID